jgi:formate dehydrogenase subunit gamma
MEIFRRGRNPWGEDVIIGLGWDLFWVVVVLGALFVVGHAIVAFRKPKVADVEPPTGGAIPEKLERHNLSARISHWLLAASVLTLLVTSFVPIFGLKFPWVTVHWIAGVVFTLYLVYHTVDTLKRKSMASMWVSADELKDGLRQVKSFTAGEEDGTKAPKWGVENKLFHHVTGLAGLGTIATGLLMMYRVDTWFWSANPYILSIPSRLWGWTYWLHGMSAVGFVGLLMAHVYFAVRPDNFFLTRSMILGWIPRKDYLKHYDPRLWRPKGVGRPSSPVEVKVPDSIVTTRGGEG